MNFIKIDNIVKGNASVKYSVGGVYSSNYMKFDLCFTNELNSIKYTNRIAYFFPKQFLIAFQKTDDDAKALLKKPLFSAIIAVLKAGIRDMSMHTEKITEMLMIYSVDEILMMFHQPNIFVEGIIKALGLIDDEFNKSIEINKNKTENVTICTV